MKKIILMLLVISITVCSLCSCSVLDKFNKKDDEMKTVAFHQMTITLPTDLVESGTTDNTIQLFSDTYGVKIVRVRFSDITPKEGYSFPNLYEFLAISGLTGNILESDVKDEDGQKIVELDTDDDGKPNRFFTAYEDMDAYWAIAFTWADGISYETGRAKSMEWAKSVTFAPVAE